MRGVPIEFGNRYILPMLGQFAKKYPLVKFQIRFGHTVGLKEELSNNRLDIAVVDQYHFGSEFYQKVLAKEELTLCGHSQYKLPPIQQKLDKLITLPLIDYDEGATLLRQWFKHHYRVKTLKLSLRASAMDVQGIATLIAEGVGGGVLPHKIALERDLFIFKANGPRLINNMSVVYLKKNQSQLVKLFNEFLIHSEK